MLKLSTILIQLYPSKTEEEILDLVDKCNNVDNVDYDTLGWQIVKKEDLNLEQTKLKLINNLFESQTRYLGVDNEILRKLEEWSEGTIIFNDMDIASSEFYQRYYCYLAWLNFARNGYKRQMFLLGTRFLLMACVWDIPILDLVQRHFAQFHLIKIMKEDANLFSGVMTRNLTLLGDEKGVYKQVGEWIKLFNDYVPKDLNNAVDEFLENTIEISRLSASNQEVLSKIITLYWNLASGTIWREIDFSEVVGLLKSDEKSDLTKDDYYIQAIQQADTKDFTKMYLQDYQDIADWIDQSGKTAEFVKKLVRALATKVNLKDQVEVSLLLQLMNALKEKGVENIDNIVYYDEQTGEFTWDKNLVS